MPASRPSSLWLTRLLASCSLALLAACGGGGSSTDTAPPKTPETPGKPDSGGDPLPEAGWVAGVFAPSSLYANRCAAPRTGIDSYTGNPFPDKSGRTLDENNWLRSWSNDSYLWYSEIVDSNPAFHATLDYFELLKTTALTPSGIPKDQFHFSYPSDVWNALSTGDAAPGYGMQWAWLQNAPPRELIVAYVEPGSPAAGIARGARLLEINGIDLVNENSLEGINALNAALFPSITGLSTEFTIQDAGASVQRTVTLQSAQVTSVPVQSVKTFLGPNSRMVGYMQFNSHILSAERQLVNAVNQLSTEGATELIVDLRYNGGGYLDIASQLAYMIAGRVNTQGKVFERTIFNDKIEANGSIGTPLLFHSTGFGASIPKDEQLPSLNLRRVYVLTGSDTCSASESIINGLRGIDIEVVQIGATTCGKPYGFFAEPNCGNTYFSIQFRGENAKGFGDYSDGMPPTCAVPDDFEHALGDPREARMAAALTYMATGACPPSAARARGSLARTAPLLRKPEGLSNRILQKR